MRCADSLSLSSRVYCWALGLALLLWFGTPAWSDSPSPQPSPNKPTMTPYEISEELVNLSDRLVERLTTREQSVIDLTEGFETSSQPLLQDSENLGESLGTTSTLLGESTPLLDSSETGFEEYKRSIEAELRKARFEAEAWKWAAGAGTLAAAAALLWGFSR